MMCPRISLIALLVVVAYTTASSAEPLTYEGDAGIGKGKHIVFIASDHEYRSEETLPALARILAKHRLQMYGAVRCR